MRDSSIRVLTGPQVLSSLSGREAEIIRTVRGAYEAHDRGESSLPHSTFLRFPDDDANRMVHEKSYDCETRGETI